MKSSTAYSVIPHLFISFLAMFGPVTDFRLSDTIFITFSSWFLIATLRITKVTNVSRFCLLLTEKEWHVRYNSC